MRDADAPQVEPLKLTLEELVIELSEDDCFLLCVGDTWSVHALQWPEYPTNIGIGSTPWEAASRALDRPFVPRDDTAELVEALERVTRGALWDDLVDRWLVQPEAMERVRAVLARVKGGER